MTDRARRRHAQALALLLTGPLAALSPAWPHASKDNARLPTIGRAAPFTLTTTAGHRFALADLRGKVLAVTFMYASCTDTCPLLMAKLVSIARQFGSELGPRVAFVAISVDPERDTPEVLRSYAKSLGADVEGWQLLTGTTAEIKAVLEAWGVYARRNPRGDVDHLFLTSLVDRRGMLRVQYLGWRFNPAEMRADLQRLVRE